MKIKFKTLRELAREFGRENIILDGDGDLCVKGEGVCYVAEMINKLGQEVEVKSSQLMGNGNLDLDYTYHKNMFTVVEEDEPELGTLFEYIDSKRKEFDGIYRLQECVRDASEYLEKRLAKENQDED